MSPKLHPILLALSAFVCGHSFAAEPRTPAFPGAEGAGKWSKGGRGGRVIAVVNLEDSGPGSLRAALETQAPRTVIFRVSGTIELKTMLRVEEPFLTIAGQTAPGDGICVKGRDFSIQNTHDIIVRHLRCRPGDKTSKPGEVDAISVLSSREVIIDHCSATWSTDECLSVTRDSDRVTVQHCLIAEALTSHALGSLIGSYRGRISFLQNVFASNRARNPRASGYHYEPGHADDPWPQIDFRHNTIYNWTSGAGYTGTDKAAVPERIAMNYAGNYLKPGPDTLPSYRGKAFTIFRGGTAELFLEGNQIENTPHPIERPGDLIAVRPGSTLIQRDAPLDFDPLPEKLSARTAYLRALQEAGATRPRRDAVDTRILRGVRDGSGTQPKHLPADAWPVLRSAAPPCDIDGDGLPDDWETGHGLNPRDPTDAAAIATPEGYTHLEVWLNSL